MVTHLNIIVNTIEGDLYNHLMNMRVLDMTMNKVFTWAPETMRQVSMTSLWIHWLSCVNPMFFIIGEMGYSEKKQPFKIHLPCISSWSLSCILKYQINYMLQDRDALYPIANGVVLAIRTKLFDSVICFPTTLCLPIRCPRRIQVLVFWWFF